MCVFVVVIFADRLTCCYMVATFVVIVFFFFIFTHILAVFANLVCHFKPTSLRLLLTTYMHTYKLAHTHTHTHTHRIDS